LPPDKTLLPEGQRVRRKTVIGRP